MIVFISFLPDGTPSINEAIDFPGDGTMSGTLNGTGFPFGSTVLPINAILGVTASAGWLRILPGISGILGANPPGKSAIKSCSLILSKLLLQKLF